MNNNLVVTADFNTKHNLNRLGANLFEVALDTDLLVRLQVTTQGKWVATGMSWDLISQGPKVVRDTIDDAVSEAVAAFSWAKALPINIVADKATKELSVPINGVVKLVVPVDGPDRQTEYKCHIQDKSGKTYPVSAGRTFIVAMKEGYTTWQINNL